MKTVTTKRVVVTTTISDGRETVTTTTTTTDSDADPSEAAAIDEAMKDVDASIDEFHASTKKGFDRVSEAFSKMGRAWKK